MELLIKCTALALFSAVSALLIRRVNPELSLAISVASVVVIMISVIMLLRELTEHYEVTPIFSAAAAARNAAQNT